jgi:hypothetical protein
VQWVTKTPAGPRASPDPSLAHDHRAGIVERHALVERHDRRAATQRLIPDATGRLLVALAGVAAELPISTLDSVIGAGRTRSSGPISDPS